MSINRLKVSAFRCFDEADFQFSSGINVLAGINGIGKTSVLEAIHFLSTGKSFRTPLAKSLIKVGHSSFSLFCQIKQGESQFQLGCQLNKSLKKNLKLNNTVTKKQTDLASTLPVLSIDPNSYLFCDNSPQFRRSFLDWMVFHVKHDYINLWSKVMRCQKHINQLLKTKQTTELSFWIDQYIVLANNLNRERLLVFNKFQQTFKILSDLLLPEVKSTELSFYPGWSLEEDLASVIQKDWEKNILYGQLKHGVHRMDIAIKTSGLNIKSIFSRGQKKMVALICYLSCLQVMDSSSQFHSVLCLDDFDAELDNNNSNLFFEFLKTLPNQIIISTVEASRYHEKDVNMFHVKHS